MRKSISRTECLKSLSTNKKNGMPYISPCFVKCDKAEPTKRWDMKVQTSETQIFFFFFDEPNWRDSCNTRESTFTLVTGSGCIYININKN